MAPPTSGLLAPQGAPQGAPATLGAYRKMQEAEGARRGKFAAEAGFGDFKIDHLAADGGALEGDLELNLEARGRQKRGALVALFDHDRSQDFDEAARLALGATTGAVEKLDEGKTRAVHDRGFGPVDLDDDIVDAQSRQGRHKMFDGRDDDAGGIGDFSIELSADDGVRGHRNAVIAVGDVGADKHHARIDRSRPDGDADMLARVNAYPGADSGTGQGVLFQLRVHETLDPLSKPIFRPDRNLDAPTLETGPAAPQHNSCFQMFRPKNETRLSPT